MTKRILAVSLVVLGGITHAVSRSSSDRPRYEALSEIEGLFPHSKEAVEAMAQGAIDCIKSDIEAIISQKADMLTFDSTFRALDRAKERFDVVLAPLVIYNEITPDKEIREASTKAVSQMNAFVVDTIELNEELYAVLCAAEKKLNDSQLSSEEQYFVTETMKAFNKKGLGLPAKQKERIKALKKELADLEIAFDKNISAATKTLAVTRDELKGVDESFIKSLETNDDGTYNVTTGYAHYRVIMNTCAVEQTRKRLCKAFDSRGYPENKEILTKVIALRHELATILGYKSFAHFLLEDEMVLLPERVTSFLDDIYMRAIPQAKKDLELHKNHRPDGITVTNGKFNAWDIAYVRDQYRKKYLQIDTMKIAEYLPMKHTLPALLSIYEEFFGITFKEEAGTFWHEDVIAYRVYKDDVYRGMILLDLYPRPFKRTHPGCMPLVPARRTKDGSILPAVALVMANYSKDHPERPSLLQLNEVSSFFHEFGHALHALFGATKMASFSGLEVKLDFVEMPSQMLEKWLTDKDILKRISSHYKTNEPLPDELINNILKHRNFDKASFYTRQSFLARLSLAYYLPGAEKDVDAILKSLYEKYMLEIHFDPANKFYASFIHLMGYGPRYYGYLWSQVFAIDLFKEIEKHGLTNPEIGNKYIDAILSKGASKHPEELLKDFLGRDPSSEAFFEDTGLLQR